MKLNYEIKNLIKPINKNTKVSFIELSGYNIIFLVIPDDNDFQMIIINKTKIPIEINDLEIQNSKLIIYYNCDGILNLNHVVVSSKILYYNNDHLVIDFMSDIKNETYYEPELQYLLTKFESKKIVDLLLYSDMEIRELFKNNNISKIIMENPIYYEEDQFSEDLFENSFSDDSE